MSPDPAGIVGKWALYGAAQHREHLAEKACREFLLQISNLGWSA